MCKNEILAIMYEYACKNDLCKNKKSFAKLIGISETNYSKVFADTNERFCTINVLLKANAALNNVFSSEWLMYSTGEMYAQNNNVPAPAPAPTQARVSTMPTTKPSFDDDDIEYLRHRIAELEKFNASLLRLNQLLEKEISDLKKGHASARAN